ncbi:hypothetical protein HDU77_007719 [Chytriomyces hyalinus]|nr:hypothetical protein HDU77_007719 [Chytriomyces hyalinus]
MNNEELHRFASDFRQLRADMIDKSNQLLSMVEAAIRRSTTVSLASNENFTCLDFGIRITEGDYIASVELSQPCSQLSMFSEGGKRSSAKSAATSQHADINSWGIPSISRAKSKTSFQSQMPLVHSVLAAAQKKSIQNLPNMSNGVSAPAGRRRSATSESGIPPMPFEENVAIRTSMQQIPKVSVNESLKRGSLKSSLSMVSEKNSSSGPYVPIGSAFTSATLHRFPASDAQKKFTPAQFTKDSGTPLLVESPPSSPEQDAAVFPENLVGIKCDTFVVSRRLHSVTSSMEAHASVDSEMEPLSPEHLLPISPTETSHMPFRRSASRQRLASIRYLSPMLPVQQSNSEEMQKKATQVSLFMASAPTSRKQSYRPEELKIQRPNFMEYFLLFPAFDHKGRHISVEALAAFGNTRAVFQVNGIHPRSQFSNIWDLLLGFVMFGLLWLIPFVAAYNPRYDICNINLLALSISMIFLCDSIVSVMTPQLVSEDFTFDLREYENARPTLSVWIAHWLKKKLLINLLAALQAME